GPLMPELPMRNAMTRRPSLLSRREVLKTAAGAAGAVIFAPMINLGRYRLFADSPQEYSARAIRLVERSLVIDMLGLFTLDGERQSRWHRNPETFSADDLREIRESGITVFHPAVGLGGLDAYSNALRFFAFWNGFLAGNDETLLRIDSPGDLERVKTSGKIGVILGLQNSDHFRRPDDVDLFHALGQRVSQLTYNSRNRIGNGSTERVDGGISDFGVAIIERMNAVALAIDVSHCGDRTTLDAFEASRQPVLITHSNCRALVPGHPRTKTDEAIRAMARTGGVMGITGVRMFVKHDEPTTIEHVLDHFDHVRDLVGVEHIGVGSDIDLRGYDAMPPEQNARLRAAY